MNIEILFEDEHYIIVNKPSGLLVHPYKKESNERDHLMKRVKAQTGHYLYPIHRIDRPVSGIVVFALSSEAARDLQAIWKDNVTKEYLTLCRRNLELPGVFNFELSDDNGNKKEALTRYFPIKLYEKYTYCRVEIVTGRKHQIRRHFSRRCYNLVGDTKYGKGVDNRYFREEFNLNRIFLHSAKITFEHPYTNKVQVVQCQLPELLQNVLENLV